MCVNIECWSSNSKLSHYFQMHSKLFHRDLKFCSEIMFVFRLGCEAVDKIKIGTIFFTLHAKFHVSHSKAIDMPWTLPWIYITHTHMHKLFCRVRELWAMTAINLTVRTGNKRLTLLTNMRVLRYINIDLDPNRSMFYVQQLRNTSGSGNGCRWCCFKMVFRFICYHIECT